MSNKKTYRKLAASSIAATAAVAAIAPVAIAADTSFTDVKAGDSHYEAITSLVEQGVIKGYEDGTFQPGKDLSRAHAAVLFANALGLEALDASEVEDYFSDVDADHQYAGYIAAVAKAGVFKGSNGEFQIDKELTREAMASTLVNAFDLSSTGADVDVNLDNVSSTHKANVQILANLGITNQLEDFNPKATVTRGQFASFLFKSLEVVANPEVVSVSAINANEILVTFNKELNKASAESIGNYSIDTDALANDDKVSLRSDKKSVVIKLGANGAITGGLLSNNTAYEVAVNKALVLANGDTLGSAQSKTIVFKDVKAPTVSSVKSDESGDVTVTFSERLNESVKPDIVLNEVTVNEANVTHNGDGTVTIAAADPAVSSLSNKESYTVVVSGATDLAGNAMSLYSSTFTYSIVNEMPVVTSVKADGETTIEVKFDEALSGNLVDGTTVKVYKGASLISSSPATSDNKTFSVDLAYGDVYAAGETSSTLRVVIEGYKDAQNNVGLKYENSVTLVKDTVKPVAQKAEYDSDTELLTVTFSEGLAAELAADFDGKLFVTDSSGVRYDVTDAAAAAGSPDTELIAAVDVAAGEDTVVFNASEFTNGTYNLTIGAGAFTDEANTPNATVAHTIQFVVGDSSDSGAPTVTSVNETSKGTFEVLFSEPVKGGNVTGSATYFANYKINGVTLPSGTTIYLNQAKTLATITVPEGTISNSGTKLVTVSGVQDLAGNVMDTDTRTAPFTDNTKPELLSASINSSNKLVVQFSEAVTGVTATDLEVTINGAKIASGNLVVGVNPSNATQYIVTGTGYNFATGTITVKTLDDATLPVDGASNTLVVGTVKTATR
ncbi:S-layer homology domain-containing protein [Ornithinibacillus californiensis]|uniref:S-layer homology domain-containing protein n=1 Tax=Ornithinibacillus californiensis TaxID=161536 RepID=UPI00064E0B14|nr:S-layer homology domain-containing protein [Ornithinibacillus californiensis]